MIPIYVSDMGCEQQICKPLADGTTLCSCYHPPPTPLQGIVGLALIMGIIVCYMGFVGKMIYDTSEYGSKRKNAAFYKRMVAELKRREEENRLNPGGGIYVIRRGRKWR